MQIINISISELKPYTNNPRNNAKAVQLVARSIKQFGFKQPLVIDRDGVIVCGHTRYLAAQKLGIKELPCVIADDLTPKQIKAYRIADNKVSEASSWDEVKLSVELAELAPEFNLEALGFSVAQPEFNVIEQLDNQEEKSASEKSETSENREPHITIETTQEVKTGERERLYYGDAREATANAYLLYDYDPDRAAGKYNMPKLKAVQYVPSRLIGFNYMLTSSEYDAGIHFYLDDYQFERIWNRPDLYIEKLKAFDCALTPDFSLYLNMPLAMKVWNIYRSRLIGQMMQDAGIIAIPTLSWAEKETFEFCFDGIEPGGVVSVSTIGVKQDKEAAEIWRAGMDEAMKRLKPSAVVVYGGDIGYEFGKTKSVYISNDVIDRWKERQ